MKLTVTIPDELFEQLTAITPAKGDVAMVAAKILEAFPVDLRETNILLNNEDRKEIEKLLGVPTPNRKELLRRIASHASVTIGNVRVEATAAQMQSLARRAKANGRTPQEEADKIFKDISPKFFGYV